MRERNSSASHSAAPAAIAPHRIPLFRTMYVVAATILFFFLNLFFIYVYVQNESHVAFERPASHAHLAGFQDHSEAPHSNAASMTAGFYSCNITDPLAIKALERAKTENCKRKITEAACKLKNGVFHDIFPVSQCSNHDQSLVGRRVGCFEDHSNNRTLDGFQYDFKGDNSPAKCRSFCYRAGFVYYGLEFGRECFCGDSVSSRPLDQGRCNEYKCPGDDSSHCGGFNAVEVFHSGFKKPYLFPKAKHEEDSNKDVTVPRILFLLQLNGRNERQVKRLFKAIYSPSHYYYIHVDQRQLYMLTEMKAVAAKIPNVFVAPDAHSTIWGGASLLTMVQDAIRRSIEMPSFSGWDYLINLSESDFPVMTLHDFETQLRLNMGKSYMSSHGYNAARFIQKQGFDFVFVECENRMWRVGKRDEFPRNLRVDGGSDWIVLHKEFALYSISDDELPTKMRNLFSSVILPVESFFHTLAYNSRFCESVIGSNLRLTNWNRKQGCRCESLKRVVDWCGCSPLVFTKEHTHKFSLKNAKAKPFYLARKFESLIDIDAVALAEEQAMRDRPHLLHTKDPMFNVTFVNHYKADIDGYSPHFSLMAETLLSMHSEQLAFLALTRIDVVKLHSSAPHQMVFTMQVSENAKSFPLFFPNFLNSFDKSFPQRTLIRRCLYLFIQLFVYFYRYIERDSQIRDSDTPFELLVERKLVSNIVSPAIVDGFRLEVRSSSFHMICFTTDLTDRVC
ncbi:unnamed protein product [Nippostrongylus brasiliensis]|uniref:protein xylosyltransferase n=1 Tax=Nippostrongylus brasiliensis TaxID=27835 RepID=A0A0N4XFC1_NIPBR|nr:unnamed protein product [Nippostrongylus brasiliensis]